MPDATPRLATPADNAALLDLFGVVPMTGDLVLSTRREPDFFALYAMQRAEAHTYVADGERGLVGLASALLREGWLDGEVTRVGYLGDLRVRFDRGRTFARNFGDGFEDFCRRTGCTAYYTSLLASNRAAIHALVRRSPRRPSQPCYHPLKAFDAVSIQLTRRRRPSTDFTVRSATAADLPRLIELLAADHRRRAFGYRFDAGELEHRFAHWPGLALEETLLVEGAGELLGCATLWDPSAVKRFQVLSYRGALRWLRWTYNPLATVCGWPRLPAPGGTFRYAYLANVSVRGEDPRVFRALLEHAYERLRPRGLHFFTFALDEGDPLAAAVEGFTARRLGFQLFAVSPASVSRTQWPTGRTGFEIALA